MRLSMERRPVAALLPHLNNAKAHPADQVSAIAASIERFGFNDPIGITPEGVIVEGHGRLEAARQLGLEDVPVLVLHGMTEREYDLYRIAHNKIALSTGFDPAILAENLRALVGDDITLSSMGFDESAADALLAGYTPNSTANEVSAAPEVKPSLDYVVIWNSDAEKKEFETFLQALRHPGEAAAAALLRRMNETFYATDAAGEDHAAETIDP